MELGLGPSHDSLQDPSGEGRSNARFFADFKMWCSFVGTTCYSSLTPVGENAGMVGFGFFLATLKSALLSEKRVRISRLGNWPTILARYVCITYARHLFSGLACRACASVWFNMWCGFVGRTCYSSLRLGEKCGGF